MASNGPTQQKRHEKVWEKCGKPAGFHGLCQSLCRLPISSVERLDAKKVFFCRFREVGPMGTMN